MLKKLGYYAFAATLVLGAFLAVLHGYGRSQYDLGFSNATADILKESAKALESNTRSIASANQKVTEYEKLFSKQRQKTAALYLDIDRVSERLRVQEGSDLQALGQASDSRERRYAEAILRDFGRLEQDIVRFGKEAAECSTHAYRLAAALEAANALNSDNVGSKTVSKIVVGDQ